MAKITRFTQKIFGRTAGISQIGVFGSLAAGSPTYTSDPATAQSLTNFDDGWFAAVVGENSPAIQDRNSLDFVETSQLAYILQAGIPEWDAGTTYYIGSIAQDGLGNIYISQQNANINNALTNASFWATSGGSVRTITASATALASDNFIRADSSTGSLVLTLPAVASVPVGKKLTIKYIETAGSNIVTVQANASELIDNANTFVLGSSQAGITIENNGTSWNITSTAFLITSNSVGTSAIVNQSITQAKLAPRTTGTTVPAGGVAISGSSGSFSSTNTSPVQVPNFSVTIVTTGRPVTLQIGPDGTTNAFQMDALGGGGTLQFARNGTQILLSTTPSTTAFYGFNYTDFPPAGTYTYTFLVAAGSAATQIINARMIVYET